MGLTGRRFGLKSNGYAEVRKLGQGAFGLVILVQRADVLYVAKLQKFKHLSKVEKEYMMREVQTMHTISKGDGHPYLVRLRQSFVDGSMLAIIMDYCDSGDLQQRIAAQRPLGWYFDERTVQAWLAQLLSAVDFLHHSKILHRDIKPANIFMNGEDTLKLGDLGLSKCSQAATSAQKHTQCGSPLYLAPEVHLGMEYSKSVDMWGVGCTMFEVMMLEVAFQGKNKEETLRNIVRARHVAFHGNWSKKLISLLKSMLMRWPEERLGSNELLRDPYFRDIVILGKLDPRALAHKLEHVEPQVEQKQRNRDLSKDQVVHIS